MISEDKVCTLSHNHIEDALLLIVRLAGPRGLLYSELKDRALALLADFEKGSRQDLRDRISLSIDLLFQQKKLAYNPHVVYLIIRLAQESDKGYFVGRWSGDSALRHTADWRPPS